MGVAIQVRTEDDAFFDDFADTGEAEDLKSAGIGEDGARPGHEAVQSAEGADELVTGAQVEVIGIAEEDLDVEILGEVALGEALDGGLGADGHEDGRADIAVRGMQYPGAGPGDGALGLDFEGDLAEHA